MDPDLYKKHEKLQKERHWWFAGRENVIYRLLTHYLKPANFDRRVLDVGCGVGGNAEILKSFGPLTGIDTAAVAVSKAKYETVIQCSIHDLPLTNKYDLITFLDVLEHITDDQSALSRAFELCVPNGFLLVTVPAHPLLWSDHDIFNHHKRRYKKNELEEKIKRAGFRVIKTSYFMTTTFPCFALLRLSMRAFKKLSRSRAYYHLLTGRPPLGINKILSMLISLEARTIPHHSLPNGSSLICLAQKTTRTN